MCCSGWAGVSGSRFQEQTGPAELKEMYKGCRIQEQPGPYRMTRLQMSLEEVKRRDRDRRAVNRA